MSKKIDLIEGSIPRGIIKLLIPIISGSFVQMAYNMADMLWLGQISSGAVAAAGAGGFFIWLCSSLAMTTKIGAEITISQSIGAKNLKRALDFAKNNISLAAIMGLAIAAIIYIFAESLISLFNFDKDVKDLGISYLKIVAPGLFIIFNINTFVGIYNGSGDTKTPFKVYLYGLLFNIVLDPILIYGYLGFPALGVVGAAIATLTSLVFTLIIFYIKINKFRALGDKIKIYASIKKDYIRTIIKLGLPTALQSSLFAMFSMTLASIASKWGHAGVAAQSIGGQVEAITWMTSIGLSTALGTFTGQNFGANKYGRIIKGYRFSSTLALGIGLFSGLIFYFFGYDIFRIFVPHDPTTIEIGGNYMRILAYSQIFMAIELVVTGVFNGCGKTIPPAIIGIVLTGARIPLALYLSSFPSIGINGIWLSITISSILKGCTLQIWFEISKYKILKLNKF